MSTFGAMENVSQAAKVIRIIHNNHAAASDYLHSVLDASGMSRGEFRSHLRYMDLKDYIELVEDLDTIHKTTLFDKVARMRERIVPGIPMLDKDTTKKYFNALGLKARGLNSKDVRKEVKNPPPPTDDVPPTPMTQVKEIAGNKRKREEDSPVAPISLPEPNNTQDNDRVTKKLRVDPVQSGNTESTGPVLTKSQRQRQRQREKRKALLASRAPVDSKGAAPASLNHAEVSDMNHPEPISKPDIPQLQICPAKPESEDKPKKRTRRARKKPKGLHVQQTGAIIVGNEIAATAEARTTESGSTEIGTIEHEATKSETSELEEPDTDQEPSQEPQSDPINDNVYKFISRTTLPLTGKPTITSTRDNTVHNTTDRHQPSISEVTSNGAGSETRSPSITETKHKSRSGRIMDQPQESEGIQSLPETKESGEDEDDAAAVAPSNVEYNVVTETKIDGSPTEKLVSPEEQTQLNHPPVTKGVLVSQQRSRSSPAGSPSRHLSPMDREESPAHSVEYASPPHKQSGGFTSLDSSQFSKSLQLAKFSQPASFVSNFAPADHRQNSRTSFGFHSLNSPSTSLRPQNASSTPLTAAESFRNFNAFLKGKRPDEDDSTSEDESSSSSSDSEDEEEQPPRVVKSVSVNAPEKQETTQKESYEVNIPALGNEVTVDSVDMGTDPTKVQDTPEVVEPSVMEIDSGEAVLEEQSTHHGDDIDVDMPTAESALQFMAGDDQKPVIPDQEREATIERSEDEVPATFQSFHENMSPNRLPEPSPMPEIQDLMEYGAYNPSASLEEQYSEPSNCDGDANADLTNSPRNNLREPYDDHKPQSNTSGSDVDSNEDKHEDTAAEAVAKSDNEEQTSPQHLSSTNIDLTEIQDPEEDDNLDGYLAVFEEAGEQFESRIKSLREKREQDTRNSPESRKQLLQELLENVIKEEEMYTSRTEAARRAVEQQPNSSQERLSQVVDRAEDVFARRVAATRATLQEEYDAESANLQLSPSKRFKFTEPTTDESLLDTELTEFKSESGQSSPKMASIEQDSSPGGSTALDDHTWNASGEEESIVSPPRRRTRKSTGAKSQHFATPSPKKKRVPAGTSAVPFPKLSAPRFGLVQEELVNDPFRLLIAVTFLNKTAGRTSMPIFRQMMELYPTPEALAAADPAQISPLIYSLGFQNQRARKLVAIAKTWVENPPKKGIRYRTRDYPNHGDGRQLKPNEIVEEDAEDCAGALEIAHIYGSGPYAWDSWRIFCRDKFRGVAEGYNGEGIHGYASSPSKSQSGFEPEWKRVVPLDKELRACLRWMWLREGWEWDPLTGKKRVANVELMREASEGAAVWDETVQLDPHGIEQDGNAASSLKKSTTEAKTPKQIAKELESPSGPEVLVPDVKTEEVAVSPEPRVSSPEPIRRRLRPRPGRDVQK